MTTTLRVPYITAWSGETVPHPLGFAWSDETAGLRLTYADPCPQDWLYGALWARQGLSARGRPEWKLVNTLRQRRCMLHLLCQVCGGSAVDSGTSRTWWLLADEPARVAPERGYTNAPPTCPICIPSALASCPRLRHGAVVYTVGACEPYGILGDVFEPGDAEGAVQVQRNATVSMDSFRMLERVLAKQLLVVLDDLQLVEGPRSTASPGEDPSCPRCPRCPRMALDQGKRSDLSGTMPGTGYPSCPRQTSNAQQPGVLRTRPTCFARWAETPWG